MAQANGVVEAASVRSSYLYLFGFYWDIAINKHNNRRLEKGDSGYAQFNVQKIEDDKTERF